MFPHPLVLEVSRVYVLRHLYLQRILTRLTFVCATYDHPTTRHGPCYINPIPLFISIVSYSRPHSPFANEFGVLRS